LNEAKFFDQIRATLFAGKLSQDQVAGIKGLLTAFDLVGDRDQDTLAYGLATAYHETGRRMIPVREGFAKSDAGARKAVAKLALKRGPQSAVAKYSQAAGPYGHVYYGRGHPQLTWLDNYRTASADAGVDLVKDPDAMLDPVISARVLFRGIMDGRWNGRGKGIAFYEGDDDFLDDTEAAEARRTVNVKDKALLIAGYHRKFYDALDLAGWSPVAPRAPAVPAAPAAPTPPAARDERPPAPPAPAPELVAGSGRKSTFAAILAALVRWLASLKGNRQ
jgi:hypothetical protein